MTWAGASDASIRELFDNHSLGRYRYTSNLSNVCYVK